jgi:hypothetical protein
VSQTTRLLSQQLRGRKSRKKKLNLQSHLSKYKLNKNH